MTKAGAWKGGRKGGPAPPPPKNLNTRNDQRAEEVIEQGDHERRANPEAYIKEKPKEEDKACGRWRSRSPSGKKGEGKEALAGGEEAEAEAETRKGAEALAPTMTEHGMAEETAKRDKRGEHATALSVDTGEPPPQRLW